MANVKVFLNVSIRSLKINEYIWRSYSIVCFMQNLETLNRILRPVAHAFIYGAEAGGIT